MKVGRAARRARIIVPWLGGVAAALWIVAHATYVADLSAFLPAKPTPLQQQLVDQLRDGPASRLILIALEGGEPRVRALVSSRLAGRLRNDAAFSSVDDGEPVMAAQDRDFLFKHRYLLSDAVTTERFSPAGLHAALGETLEYLASSTGLMLKSIVPHDPTGELLHVLDKLADVAGPRTQNGVWVSADGTRALLVAQTAAAGSDTDAQERDLQVISAGFRASVIAAGPAASALRLRMSGPGVFAVEARAKIKRAALRLSIVSSLLVIGVLFSVYRSVAALILGLLPVATGALCGVAGVALGFGAVHGVTLGFGVTLIGESVDYSVYFFIQSIHSDVLRSAPGSWQRLLWPTVRLGMLTSVCGFASLLPSGFPGLAQLGLYSISGLIAAALVTRFVLPVLVPDGLKIRNVAPLGAWMGRRRDSWRRFGGFAVAGGASALAIVAVCVLYRHQATLWDRELSNLSPVSIQDQRYDAMLRSDLGAADVLDLVIVEGASLEAVLRGAEQAQDVLQRLTDDGTIGRIDSPANYLPSIATQQNRRAALPDGRALEDNLRAAAAGLDLDAGQLSPFIADVGAARRGALVTMDDLRGTSLAAGFGALILHRSGHWSALLPLHAVKGAAGPKIDVGRVAAALAAAHLEHTEVLDMKAQTDALYASYLSEAMRLSSWGFALIVILLLVALRSPLRVARVLAPLVLAVLVVAAGLAVFGQPLTILHLVGMLLIVAVGSNYALFFDHQGSSRRDDASPLTLASLGIANLSTVIGFGLLSFSQVPVLEALGQTVSPGAFLALVFSAVLTSPAPPLGVLGNTQDA